MLFRDRRIMFFRTYKSLLDIQKKALERGQETGMKIKLVLFYFCVCLIFCEILAATKAKKALKVRLLLELHKATKKRLFPPLVILITSEVLYGT